MRIAKLDLIAFGPFSNTRLDFDVKPQALQVIYGGNEAGKSSTLRAITQLLYGIPHRTRDAHVHEQSKLRIAATLVDSQGAGLKVVRRKGKDRTLLDGQGEPLDESIISALLGGTSESLFRSMFGLDHAQLREGAEALLAGGGDLGEGLFDAGVGGAPVHRVLSELRDEAEALYKPRGQTPRLNAALKRARELAKQRRGAALAPEKWQAQREALERAQALHAQLTERRRTLSTEDRRLARALTVLPKLAKLDALERTRKALGDVPALDADATARRVEAERQLAASTRELAHLSERHTRLTAELEALGDAPRGQLGERVIRELRERYGSYLKAEQDLPQRNGELRAAKNAIENLRARLDRDVLGRNDAAFRLPASLSARLNELAEEGRTLAGERGQLERERASRKREIDAYDKRLTQLGQARDVRVLEALLRDPRAQGEPSRRLRERATEALALETRLARGLGELGLETDPAQLARLALPAEDRLRARADERARLDTEHSALRQEQTRLERERADVDRERKALTAAGEVPSEPQLQAARTERDECFARLERALEQGKRPASDDLAQYPELTAQADALADRLRREAERVRHKADLDARDERNQADAEALRARLDTWHGEDASWHADFRALLAPAGIEPRPLREAERTVERARALQPEAERYLELTSELKREEREGLSFAQELSDALSACDTSWTAGTVDLGLLERAVQHARELLATERQRAAQAEEILQGERASTRAHDALVQQLEVLETRITGHQERWSREVSALGLPATASAAEVAACLGVLGELDRARESASTLQGRVEGMQRDMAEHEAEVRALCKEHLQRDPSTVAEGVDALDALHQRQHDAERDRKRLERDLHELEQQRQRAAESRQDSEQTLRALCERAGVERADELAHVERHADEARTLDQRLRELHEELVGLGEGNSLDTLRAEIQDIEPEQAHARRAEIEDELASVIEEQDAAKQEIGRTQGGLEHYETSDGAAELAEQQQSQLSEVHALARQYLVYRLSEQILRGEVERYREANQGPVLTRASALVGPLTLGRYTGLKVDFEDGEQPRLRLLRAEGGAEVPIDGLSDGTRDQLYLALRLASLERFLQRNTPVPLVLDDCFVHFDDDRARAALTALSRYARGTQILLFTHHSRMVELAQQALGTMAVEVHDLEAAKLRGEGRNDGPLFAAR